MWRTESSSPPTPGAVTFSGATKALQLGGTHPFSARDSLGGSKGPWLGTWPLEITLPIANLGKSLPRLIIPMVTSGTQDELESTTAYCEVRVQPGLFCPPTRKHSEDSQIPSMACHFYLSVFI